MSDGLAELEALELKPLDSEGKVPRPSRLSSASALRGLYQDLIRDDEESARKRVRVQAMVDGEPPFDQAKLNASGQGSRANANFLMGQDLINKTCNGYLDIITSVKNLVTVEVEGGEPNERPNYCRIIAQELSRTIRKWPGFTPGFLRLVKEFVTHGVGIGYFPGTEDFRFKVAGLGDFRIPRQTESEENHVLYAISRRDMTVTELYDPIQNEEAAEKAGWNVAAVKNAIGRATTSTSKGEVGELEKFQSQVKNNDLYADRQFAHVPVLFGWVREFDGTISFFIAEKDGKEDEFLFKEYNRYSSADEAFVFICYGVGNGTFHSIRGMGHMIFALVQLHSRLMCQKADGVMLDESVMLQADSANALQRASLNYMGPFSLLDNGFTVVDRKMNAGSERTLPFLNEVKGLTGQVSSRFTAPVAGSGDAYQNNLNTEASLEAASDSGSIDLFCLALDRLFREMVRRIITGPKSDKLVAEFHRRCEKAGVTEEILKSVDHDSTYATRALGAGSPAARSVAFRKLLQLLPQLDEIGRKNLIYQFVADAVGYQNADYYASPASETRLGVEAGIAESENFIIAQGADVKVFAEQMHATHVQIHLPKLLEMLDAVERGLLDPMENLNGLQAFLNHIGAHGEALATDPTQAALYAQVKEAINNLQQVVTNMERKIKAEERKAAEAGPAPEEGQPGYEEAAAAIKLQTEQRKLDLIEFKFQLEQAKGQLALAAQQSKIDQSLALGDLKGAEMAEKALRFPGTSYGERR